MTQTKSPMRSPSLHFNYWTCLSTAQTRALVLMGLSKTSSTPDAFASSVTSQLLVTITTAAVNRCSSALINLIIGNSALVLRAPSLYPCEFSPETKPVPAGEQGSKTSHSLRRSSLAPQETQAPS
jgi:hypothetical protein